MDQVKDMVSNLNVKSRDKLRCYPIYGSNWTKWLWKRESVTLTPNPNKPKAHETKLGGRGMRERERERGKKEGRSGKDVIKDINEEMR